MLLKRLLSQVRTTRDWLRALLDNKFFNIPKDIELIKSHKQLQKARKVCYRSLCENKLDIIANSKLLDTLRRLACFGATLTKIGLRQESTRLTEALVFNDDKYSEWNEEK